MPRSLSEAADRQDPAVKLAVGLLRLEQALAAGRSAAAARAELSPLQIQILMDLAQGTGGATTAAALARRYRLRAPTLSDSIASLEARGLVARRASDADRRRLELAPTPAGRALARRALRQLDVLVRIASDMPAEERAHCLESIIRIIRRLNDEGWIEADRLCVTCRYFEPDRSPNGPAPHWCRLIERPLAPADLRVDCPEHEPAAGI